VAISVVPSLELAGNRYFSRKKSKLADGGTSFPHAVLFLASSYFGFASLGLGIGAVGGNPAIIFVFLLVSSLAVILCFFRFRDFKKVSHDIEMRVVEIIEDAPQRVWIPRNAMELTKVGFCYLLLAGRTIRVPNDAYGELREANIVKVAFLPTALVAVHVESVRGLGL
jgi:hypothetical protein